MVDELIAYWASQGGKLNPGAPETLADFESRYQVRLPPDLRRLLSLVNGCYGLGDGDLCLIEFHTIQELLPIGSVTEASSGTTSGSLSFADFLIFSHDYGIWLSGDEKVENSVAVFYDQHPLVVASSFSEFVAAYLANHEAVLFPTPPR